MLLQIAWRNLWRNRRRTIITVVAVAGSMMFMLFMNGLMRGMSDRMLEALVGSSGGHVQIHREGYREDQQFTLTLPEADRLLEVVRDTEGVEGAAGRIYGFAHASFVRGDDEQVRSGQGEDVAAPMVALFGVEPEHEVLVTDLDERVQEGRWIEQETDMVIGANLARRNNIELGDAILPTTVSATGAMQGPWAVSDQVPRVVGFIRTGVDEIDSSMVIVHLGYLSRLVRLEDQIHEVAIRADTAEHLDQLVERLRDRVGQVRREVGADESLPATSELAIGPDRNDGVPPGDGAPQVELVGVDVARNAPEQRPDGLAAGRFLQRAEDILLPTAVAEQLEVSPGDRVTLAVPIDCGGLEPLIPREPADGGVDGDGGAVASACPPSSESFVVAGTLEGERLGPQTALVLGAVVRENIGALAPDVLGQLEGDRAQQVAELVNELRGEHLVEDEILPWDELNPSVAQMMEMMETAPMIFYVILYFAVLLGIVNTMLMATFERVREFGIMRAVGMRPKRVIAMVVIESALLAVVGVAAGLALGLPMVFYFQTFGLDTGMLMEGESYDIAGVVFDPVLWPTVTASDIGKLVVTIFTMTSLAGLWPAIKAARIQPTEALRHD